MSKSICLKTVCIMICVCSMLGLFGGCYQENVDQVTGEEWLLIQNEECFPDLEAFANGMDEVVTLYIMGSISETDYAVELGILNRQKDILLQRYEELKDTYPVKEGSHTYISKRGADGMDACYNIFGRILETLVDKKGTPLSRDETAYIYLSYRQELSSALAEHVTAIAFVQIGIQESSEG